MMPLRAEIWNISPTLNFANSDPENVAHSPSCNPQGRGRRNNMNFCFSSWFTMFLLQILETLGLQCFKVDHDFSTLCTGDFHTQLFTLADSILIKRDA